MGMKIAVEMDARGLLCPLPVLKARKALIAMSPESVLSILVSDPAAIVDMPHFCLQDRHTLLAVEDIDGGQRYVIRRRPDDAGPPPA